MIVLFGFLAIYVSISIYNSVFKYRVYGLSLNLLIGILTLTVSIIVVESMAIKIHKVLESSESIN